MQLEHQAAVNSAHGGHLHFKVKVFARIGPIDTWDSRGQEYLLGIYPAQLHATNSKAPASASVRGGNFASNDSRLEVFSPSELEGDVSSRASRTSVSDSLAESDSVIGTVRPGPSLSLRPGLGDLRLPVGHGPTRTRRSD